MSAPKKKEIATDRRIPMIMVMALAVLMYWMIVVRLSPAWTIFRTDTATAAPSNSKTTDTVVEVGRP